MSKANSKNSRGQRPKLINMEWSKKCLRLIAEIGERGALSWDPERVGYALQELSQVLLERTGLKSRMFEPVPAYDLDGLEELYQGLEWVAGFLEEGEPGHLWN
jgi:hypothetical protein